MPHAAVVPSDGGVAESVTLSVLMTGPDPRTNPSPILLVFVHGFPELAFSWRKQLPFFAAWFSHRTRLPRLRREQRAEKSTGLRV